MQAPELVASQYVNAGDLPKVPGWNRATNQQVARTLKQTLYYRKAGNASIATIANAEGKNIPGVQLEQKIADPTFERFARSSTNIGSNLQNVEMEEILCFNAFYREAISESQVENERTRLVKVRYFRKDGTIEISEPKQENSGLPQGIFLNRSSIRRQDGSAVDESDLRIRQTITIYGKTFLLYACDEFTRNWYVDNGMEQEPNQDAPEVLDRVDYRARQWAGKVLFPAKTFMEASLGKHTHDSKGFAKFLAHDQDTLRFALSWDNTDALFGDHLSFSMNYFLANDTVSILQSKVPNSGMEFFPRLLNRERLLKDWSQYLELHKREVGHHHGPGEIWNWTEFRIGMTLDIFGRSMKITAIDPKTRAFYKKHGIEQPENQLLYGIKAERPELQPPPYTGYGDKADSDLNWKRLLPVQPKKDYNRFIGKDGMVLRYTAKLITDNPEDSMRRFVVTYFLNDETLRVYEPPIRNSGIVGGRFLMKRKYLRDDGEDFVQPRDLQPGSTVILNKFKFELCNADQFTIDYLASISKK